MKDAVEILKKFWDYDQFRVPQAEIIEKVIEKKDVIVLLPTGSGKSLCFQVPTLMHKKGICLVISPLVALMKDQVEQLGKRNIKALALSGLLSVNEQVRLFDNLMFGDYRFLYIAPERLQSDFFLEKLRQLPINLIAVDEAHCISEWGHDFRPTYLKINILKDIFPNVNTIALTATATPRVLEDIQKYLRLNKPFVFNKTSIRDNLKINVIESANKYKSLLKLLKHKKETVIIYAGSRKNVENTSDFLNQNGLKSTFYHAGMTKEQKDKAYLSWISEKTPIIVATNAFGMGIDKPNVRKVFHTNIPNSIENYVQEIGRSGRDGIMSETYLIENISDVSIGKQLYFSTLPDESFIRNAYNYLNQYFKITYGTIPEDEFHFNLNAFSTQYGVSVVKMHYTMEIFEREGLIALSQQRENYHQIVIKASSNQLFEYYKKNPIKELIIKFLLRNYEGILDYPTRVNPYEIAQNLKVEVGEIEKKLTEIHMDGIIDYQNQVGTTALRFLLPREDQYTMNRITKEVQKYLRLKKEKYQKMLDYILDNQTCRNIQIAEYFGESLTEPCGICDVCTSKNTKKSDKKTIKKEILSLIENFKTPTINQISDAMEYPEMDVLKEIRVLLDDEILILNSQNQITFNGK